MSCHDFYLKCLPLPVYWGTTLVNTLLPWWPVNVSCYLFFYIKGILFSKKINELVGIKSDCCPNLVPLFSLTIFIQTFLHAISHSFNATEYFAHCAVNNLCVFTCLRKRPLNISLKTRNLKETESLERPYFT